MTNQEALSGMINYPVTEKTEKTIQKILIDNGLSASADYTGTSKAFELATAALYVFLVTSANVAEGGFQVSMTDKSNMIKLASGIFSKHGVNNPLKPSIRNRSHYW